MADSDGLSADEAGMRYRALGGLERLAVLQWGLPGPAAISSLEVLRRKLMDSTPQTWLVRYEPAWNALVCGSRDIPAVAGLTRTMCDLVCRYEMAYLRDRGRLCPPTHAQKPALLRGLRTGDIDAVLGELDRTWSERAAAITGWLDSSPMSGAR